MSQGPKAGRGRRLVVCREISGPGLAAKRRRLARIRRMLRQDGFIVGRKMVIAERPWRVATAFPEYIRAKRGQFRVPGEVSIAQVFALIALAQN